MINKHMPEDSAEADPAPAAPPTPKTAGSTAPSDAAPVPSDVEAPTGDPASKRPRLGELLVERGEVSTADVRCALQRQLEGDERQLGAILLEEGKAAPGGLAEALQSQTKRSAV